MDQSTIASSSSHPIQPGEEPRRRIRIAILDTGINAQCSFFSDASRWARLRKWRDFVEDRGMPVDEDAGSHGTEVVALTMKHGPAADIYVARVAHNCNDTRNSPARMIQALAWAADEEVDIVLFSLGFAVDDEDSEDDAWLVQGAIMSAQLKRKNQLVCFGAAGDRGASQPALHPARCVDVLAIYATCADRQFQPFNPVPYKGQGQCFGVVGVDLPGVSGGSDVRLTGTSFAAALVAGTAAVLLEIARSATTSDNGYIFEKLAVHWGMYEVLMALSTEVEDQRRYVDPRRFLRLDREARVTWLLDALSR
ncbi:subtilisin-like protein [Aspergillus ellipticus CBS 707.79]|uniref:Subtilisin-like protein n=1 Tax=Aspergillus ellipticus CBS 707.79 TaxID=1448320 RepID=A0A319CTG9_9EURO|nr:subtilisin-like protein [Aspergillus ellipticus CBS 707.79]